ncbi:hypothetical protein [Streptomyces sp. NBC_00557]|uniref:hypothetical protein n=1 Tax=Streptomyces sp. NBC_00557 TaxID=2975776 RepID=UPI002E7FF26C|nr:hypothetical protein [Streptomyces sp. NBC_00557]WUC34744.1 hypothetical protein OG956_11230 [Streptomyces sp. NBC_00557]
MSKYRKPAWRAMGVITALATTATIGFVAPAQAQSTAQLSAYVADGWGGGTITSSPAGINCHISAWDPYAGDQQPSPTGTCTATFSVGTTVHFSATADAGSYVNIPPDPNPVTIRAGYNYTGVVFCPNNGLCSSG